MNKGYRAGQTKTSVLLLAWVCGDPNSKAAEPWILGWKIFILEHQHSH